MRTSVTEVTTGHFPEYPHRNQIEKCRYPKLVSTDLGKRHFSTTTTSGKRSWNFLIQHTQSEPLGYRRRQKGYKIERF